VPVQAMPANTGLTITARVTDANAGQLECLVYFRADSANGFGPWNSVGDQNGPNGDLFEFTIPAQPANTQIEYYLTARDASPANNLGTFPFGGYLDPPGLAPPRDLLTFRVGSVSTFRKPFPRWAQACRPPSWRF
jgi:hypothetical protein